MRVVLDRYSGPTAFMVGWGIWLVCLAFVPVRPIFVGDFVSVGVFVLGNTAVFVGLFSFRMWSAYVPGAPRLASTVSLNWIDRFLLPALLVLGILALTARAVDYFLIRHISLALTENAVREALGESKPNVMSALFVVLNPAVYAGGILALARVANGARSLAHFLAIFVFVLAPFASVIFGGRSVLFLVFAIAGLTLFMCLPEISWRFITSIFLAAMSLFIATMMLFLNRLPSGSTLYELMLAHGFAEHVPATVPALIAIRDEEPAIAAVLYYALAAGQYVLHGVFEFFVVVQQKNELDPVLLGRYEIDLINRVWNWFAPALGYSVSPLEQYDPRSGVFATFWGPAYIDFGTGMVLVGYCWGMLVDYFRVQVARGDLLAMPFYVLSLVQLTILPFINGFSMAAASYLNIGLFALWLAGRYPMLLGANNLRTMSSGAQT